MKQIVDFKMHNFPQIKDKKVKVKVEKLDLSILKEIDFNHISDIRNMVKVGV